MYRKRTVSVEEASQVAGCVLITIDDAVLAGFGSARRSTWEDLYAWLEVKGFADDSDRRLHTRARVGDRLMIRLRARETARIRKHHKLTGEKLRSAVGWSDLGSGPMETIDWKKLKGDALFVLPPESAEERCSA